jgi:hypothetical protein
VEKAMGRLLSFYRLGQLVLASCALAVVSGCSVAPSANSGRLLSNRALIDFTGLRKVAQVDTVHASVASPMGWDRLATHNHPLYTHEQWRSPTMLTGVGVAYIHLPLPLSADAICWLARQEYAKHSKAGDGGKLIGSWTDNLGRVWFEGENSKYHVRGYVVTHGFEAWIVYFGYRVPTTPDPMELSLAMRSAETIVPNSPPPTQTQVAQK